MRNTFTALALVSLIVAAMACKHTVKYDCTGYTPTYNQNVKPILDAVCARQGCHGGADPEGGIDLSTYQGAADASKKKSFMGTIQHMPLYPKMPQDAPRMSDDQIHLLSCWIENGSPE